MRSLFSFRLNISLGKVVKYFVLSDLVLISGWGLINPIFAIFVKDMILGATLTTVGIAASIYWISKSAIQLPIAYYLDKVKGEKDDFYILVFGLLVASISAFGFIFVREIWQLYFVQLVHAIGFGMYVPSWTGIYSRHVKKKHSSFAWSLDSTIISFAAGFTGAIGGVIAQAFGFSIVFILAGTFTFIAALIIFAVPDLVFPRRSNAEDAVFLRDHTPHSSPR